MVSIGTSGLQLKLNAKSHRDGGIPGVPRLQARLKPGASMGDDEGGELGQENGREPRVVVGFQLPL